jgi:hypothetical protein
MEFPLVVPFICLAGRCLYRLKVATNHPSIIRVFGRKWQVFFGIGPNLSDGREPGNPDTPGVAGPEVVFR